MLDEDLHALHGILRRMDPRREIRVDNTFVCSPAELFWVVEEALAARQIAKDAGTFEAFRS